MAKARAQAKRDRRDRRDQRFVDRMTRAGIDRPTPEHRFHPVRRWRFDFAWPDRMLALEIEGGIWTGGRHSGGKGQLGDMEKYSEAAALGWRVIHVTPSQLNTDYALDLVSRALNQTAGAVANTLFK